MGGVGSGGSNIKDPSKRTRTNRQNRDTQRTIDMEKAPPPELDIPGHIPEQTRKWWTMWTNSPLLADSTEEDWSELQDTAILHAFVWTEQNVGTPAWFKAMAQLRQRTANYGATPLDRQRLRIQFVFAEKGEDESGVAYSSNTRKAGPSTPTSPTGSRGRRGPKVAAPPDNVTDIKSGKMSA